MRKRLSLFVAVNTYCFQLIETVTPICGFTHLGSKHIYYVKSTWHRYKYCSTTQAVLKKKKRKTLRHKRD